MKRAALAATAAVLLAMLAGCSQAPTTEAAEPSASTAPLTAETVAPETGEDVYLAEVREALPSKTVIPNATDEQLLEAGYRACDEIAAGADTLTLSLIQGETEDASGFYPDSAAIITSARTSLCD